MNMIPRMFMMFSRANASAERINRVLDDDSHTDYGTEREGVQGEGR